MSLESIEVDPTNLSQGEAQKLAAAQRYAQQVNATGVYPVTQLGAQPDWKAKTVANSQGNLSADITAVSKRRIDNQLAVKNNKPSTVNRTMRAIHNRLLTGRKPLKLLDPIGSKILSNRATKLAGGRKAVSGIITMDVDLVKAQDSYLQAISNVAKSNNDVAIAYGLTPIGLQKRREAAQANFHPASGKGKFNPYYISNGVVRGGFTARGRDNDDGTYSIPVRPGNDRRVLQSLQAKYTHPMAFPSTRIVKFIRGHWGDGKGGKWQDESVWNMGAKRTRLALE